MITLDILRLIIDFGTCVLIWVVQLVIYPSFKFYTPHNLISWHRNYTKKITWIVLPLMLSQLVLSIVMLVEVVNVYTVLSLILILLLWGLTFVVFVPLHQAIDCGQGNPFVSQKLVKYNWMRTVLWSILFFISLSHFVFN